MTSLMKPGTRKLALTAHVLSSVGWLGAVACFLALAVVGLTTRDAGLARAAYLAMEPTTWFVIVPLSVASLVTGVIQGLGTRWGLFRHYWVVVKLVLTALATVVLLVHTNPIGRVASAAATSSLGADLDGLRVQLLVDAVAAVAVLIAATALSVYKPQGVTAIASRLSRGS